MASSRLEKVGTIYSRIQGLLKSGAMKKEDIPVWYEVYAAFPPLYEPRYDRPAPDAPIRNIFYAEDIIRAKYHKDHRSLPSVNMADQVSQTQTQKFISIYSKLKEEGNTPEENLYTAALDVLKVQRLAEKGKGNEPEEEEIYSMASSFKAAQRKNKPEIVVNVKDIFKD